MADRVPGPKAPKTLSAEVLALQQQAQSESTKLRHRIRSLYGLTRAYRRLLLDENGRLKPDARTVLADLVGPEVAALGCAAPILDHEYLCQLEGQRRVVLRIFGKLSLDEGAAAQLEFDLDRMEEE